MAIELDIQKNFKGFSLDVRLKGQDGPIGILGASGSGKSMTLRSIAGIETPDSGRIIINGKTVFDSEEKINLKPQERRVGYLFQNYALFPTMTVEKNIACGYRGEKSKLSQKVADYIKRYHLEGLEKHFPSQLSGGQQQRVALAQNWRRINTFLIWKHLPRRLNSYRNSFSFSTFSSSNSCSRSISFLTSFSTSFSY